MLDLLLLELIQKIYNQGAKDHSDETTDSNDEYFDMMAQRITNLLGK